MPRIQDGWKRCSLSMGDLFWYPMPMTVVLEAYFLVILILPGISPFFFFFFLFFLFFFFFVYFFTEKSTRNFSFSQVLKTAELQVAGNLGQAAVVAVVAFRARCLGPGGQTSGLIPTSAAPRTRRDFALLGFGRKVAGLSWSCWSTHTQYIYNIYII